MSTLAIITLAETILVGWVLGTIVNWLADQLPHLGRTTRGPESKFGAEPEGVVETPQKLGLPRCLHCGHRRSVGSWSGNLAVVTRTSVCEQCGTRQSLRNVVVELWMAVALGYIVLRPDIASLRVVYGSYLFIFTLIAVIDIEHRYVLNIIMLPAFVFAIFETFVSGRVTDYRAALAGYAVAQMAVMAIYLLGGVYIWWINRSRQEKVEEVAFGFGDVTLATFCGLIVGTPDVINMLVLMIFVGFAIVIVYIILRGVIRQQFKAHMPVAYGPAILISAVAVLLWPGTVTSLLHGGR